MERNFTSPSREEKRKRCRIFMLVVIGTNLSHNKWRIYSHLITSSHFLLSQTKEIQTYTRRNSDPYAFLTTFFICNNVMSQAGIRVSKIWKGCPEINFLRIKFASFFLAKFRWQARSKVFFSYFLISPHRMLSHLATLSHFAT